MQVGKDANASGVKILSETVKSQGVRGLFSGLSAPLIFSALSTSATFGLCYSYPMTFQDPIQRYRKCLQSAVAERSDTRTFTLPELVRD